jgi:hypothetical protein
MNEIITEKDVIRAALRLVENRMTWTRGTLARDRKSREVKPTDPRAVRWCAAGAIRKAAPEIARNSGEARNLTEDAEARLCHLAQGRLLQTINDEKGRKAVVALFKKALAA